MQFTTVDDKFLETYDKIYDTLFTNYAHIATLAQFKDLERDLNAVAYEGYKEGYKSNDGTKSSGLDAKINSLKNDADFKVFQFIVLAGLSSYYGLSNLNEFVKQGNEFGYKSSFIGLKNFCRLTHRPAKDFENASLERLLSTQRDCSKAEYFSKGYYLEDVELVRKLLMDGVTRVEVSDDLKGAIVRELYDAIDAEVANIVSVYRNVLAASFGLEKYRGVFTFDRTAPVVGVTESYRYQTLEPLTNFRDNYTPILNEMVDIKHPSQSAFSDRQFNSSIIYEGSVSHPNKPIYFPHKVLEIISLGAWTSTQANVYKRCINKESQNLDSYCEYLRENFDNDIFNFCVFACKADYAKLKSEIKDQWEISEVLENINCPAREDFKQGIIDKLRYYVKCATTVFVLTELTTEKKEKRGVKIEEILSFRLKTAYFGGLISNEEFCQKLSQKIFNDPYKMDGVEPTEETTLDIGVHLRDYAYTFNADKVYARPLFAYKALEAVQSQGMTLSWDNILLGKYADGSLCRSAPNEKICLQSVQLHNLYAGSRSGKGVMCFNIDSTAVASKIPIFYLDRKPDTAVVLKALASGMFVVNGGQYDSVMDLQVQFNPSKINYRIPEYIKGEFPSTDTTVKNDFIYFRAVLLLFSLATFMDKVSNKDDDRYKRIAQLLDKGAIFVLDEFTNFVEKFLSKKPTTQGWFQECYSDSGINAWRDMLSGIQEKSLALNAKQGNEKSSEEQIATAQNKLESATAKAKSFSLSKLYFAELALCYESVVTSIPELYKAGGAFVKTAQIFVIGQEIPENYYEGATFFTRSNGASVKRYNSSTHLAGTEKHPDVPLVRMLNRMAGDYIFGYQPPAIGNPKYLAQTVDGMITKSMLTASRRCFCYYNPGTELSFAETQKISNTADAFRNNTTEMAKFLNSEFTYFKPFLILNNAVVPPKELLKTEKPVTKTLSEQRQAKGAYSKYKDSQYVGQCLTACNNAGISWEDLLNDNKDADGNLHSGVGFEGYIRKLCENGSDTGLNVVRTSLNASGQVMSILVNEVFGYKDGNWMDFLADFRPEAMFKPEDFIAAIDKPEECNVQSRLSRTFFSEALTKVLGGVSFATVFEKELGTLAQYYGTGGESYSDSESDSSESDNFTTFGYESFEDANDVSDDVSENEYSEQEDTNTYDDVEDDTEDNYSAYNAYDNAYDYDDDDEQVDTQDSNERSVKDVLAEEVQRLLNDQNSNLSKVLERGYLLGLDRNPAWKQILDNENKKDLFDDFAPRLLNNEFANGAEFEREFIEEMGQVVYRTIYSMCLDLLDELASETPEFSAFLTSDTRSTLSMVVADKYKGGSLK